MFPARVRRNDNPFITVLASALNAQGVRVSHWRPLAEMAPLDGLHVHWLEGIAWGALSSRMPMFTIARAKALIRTAKVVRDAGKPVVWTAHNLSAHEPASGYAANAIAELRASFLPLVTDVVCMAPAVREAVQRNIVELSQPRFHIIPHPTYTEHYRSLPPANLSAFTLWQDAGVPILGAIGNVRHYKQIPALIKLIDDAKIPLRLVIAGDGPDDMCRLVQKCAQLSDRVRFFRKQLSDNEIVGLTSICDGMVFNFSSSLNSGSVISALSLAKPVLAPRFGGLVDFKEMIPTAPLHLFEGDLTSAVLAQFALTTTMSHSFPADFSDWAPDRIARQHRDIYEAASRQGSRP